MTKPIENLSWVHQFLKMSRRERQEMKDRVLNRLRNCELKKHGEDIYQLLQNKDIQFVGIVPNTRYLKCSGSAAELEALWIHPHGGPALIFGHKKGGILFTVSPLLRINESIINEISGQEKKVSLEGISG